MLGVEALLACPMVIQKLMTDFTAWNRNFFADVSSHGGEDDVVLPG
jgi:hypothetical protein